MLRLLFSIFTLGLLLVSCQQATETPTEQLETNLAPAAAPEKTPAEKLLARAVNAHGGERYDQASYAFVFREKAYTFLNDDARFAYTLTEEKAGARLLDSLTNDGFVRYQDGQPVTLTAKELASGIEALNSVIYFATLPHKLTDPAVNLAYAGTDTIKGNVYEVLNVNFDQEGGGVDHDDNFRYWFHQETDRMEYLAYDYLTNNGGVRFRSAYNPREVDGILFQDYVNYKAPVGTALADLPGLYETGKLEELSRIVTEEVRKR